MKTWLYFIFIAVSGVQAQDDARVHEEVTVTLQQFQVNVLDNKNQPIKDLDKDDFQVLVDGEELEIHSVIPIESGKALKGEAVIPEAARRQFVLTFDTMHNNLGSIEKAKDAATDFIKNGFRDEDLAAVFFVRRDGAFMAQNFTNDRTAILRAIDQHIIPESRRKESRVVRTFVKSAGPKMQAGGKGRATKREGQQDKAAMADAAIASILTQADRTHQIALSTNPEIDFLVNFSEFADSLAVVEGRKNMILFSMGVSYGGTRNLLLKNIQHHLVNELMGSNTLVFGVDTSRQDFRGKKSNLDFLSDLSGTSGGRLFANYNYYEEVVDQVEQMTRHSYLVSARSTLQTDMGKLSRVRIKVNRPGARVLTTRGRELNPGEQVENELTYALQNVNEINGPILVEFPTMMDVDLGAVNGDPRLRVSLKIPGPYLLDITEPGDALELSVKTLAVDAVTGEVAAESRRGVKLDPHVRREAMEQAGLMFVSDLDLQSGGSYTVSSQVHCLTTGQTANPSLNVTIPGTMLKEANTAQ